MTENTNAEEGTKVTEARIEPRSQAEMLMSLSVIVNELQTQMRNFEGYINGNFQNIQNAFNGIGLQMKTISEKLGLNTAVNKVADKMVQESKEGCCQGDGSCTDQKAA